MGGSGDLTADHLNQVCVDLNDCYVSKDLKKFLAIFDKYFNPTPDRSKKGLIQFNTNICGLLVDLADLLKSELRKLKSEDEGFKNLENRLEGILRFEENYLDEIHTLFSDGVGYYNYANALKTTFDLKRIKDDKWLLPQNAELLIKAKRHYWLAVRETKDASKKLEIMTNLAHALSSCHRISESLYLYDCVIAEKSDFPQANYSRALSFVDKLQHLANGYSMNMIFQTYLNFKATAETSYEIHESFRHKAKLKTEQTLKLLKKEGQDEVKIQNDLKKNISEFERHTDERKFFLTNGLCLSEHALYCFCNGARRDDLSIVKTERSFSPQEPPFFLKHEHILNQLKSEYYKARQLYYEAITKSDSEYENESSDKCLSRIYEDDVIGARAEDLRQSFKMSFGILDKIAVSVCDLYDFPVGEKEKIYFEAFWNRKDQDKNKTQSNRWNKVNEIDNPSLFALYFQSTDLNSKEGEWKEFKQWRNALEHGYFVLAKNDESMPDDPLKIFNRKIEVVFANYNIFEDRTAELLRFVRSAIFNYVFCVRAEDAKVQNNEE